MMISAAAQAADRDMGTSGATFVMPVQTGTAMPVNARISGSSWVFACDCHHRILP
ncbi:MAG: hypothetical protein L7W95_06615 [Alphaproteobacteria bacterium]|nr:hypothetical protein [Alphaproteobacteria bacterium]